MKKISLMRFLPFLFATFLTIVGCQDKPKQTTTQTEYELSMTDKDTAAVANLVDQFFMLLEEDRVTDAVSILYQVNDTDRYNRVELLDNENIQRVTTLLKAFPIVSHRIDYIKFHEVYNNEVKVSAILYEATEDQPEVKTVFYFRVVDDRGRWCLCMMNTSEGDRRLISNEEADSVSTKYSNYQKEKESKSVEN